MRARYAAILVGSFLLLLSVSCSTLEIPTSTSNVHPVVVSILTRLIRLDNEIATQPIVNSPASLRLPSFIVCPSGVGRPRCYIDFRALARWLCDNRLLPRYICRIGGY